MKCCPIFCFLEASMEVWFLFFLALEIEWHYKFVVRSMHLGSSNYFILLEKIHNFCMSQLLIYIYGNDNDSYLRDFMRIKHINICKTLRTLWHIKAHNTKCLYLYISIVNEVKAYSIPICHFYFFLFELHVHRILEYFSVYLVILTLIALWERLL